MNIEEIKSEIEKDERFVNTHKRRRLDPVMQLIMREAKERLIANKRKLKSL